nr:amino acid ABC transporter permease [Thermocrispum municipale]
MGLGDTVFDFLDKPLYAEYGGILGAFWVTIQLTFFSAIGSLIWGTVLAAMRVGPVPIMRWFATAYVNIVRNVPLTVIIVGSSVVLADQLLWTLGGSDTREISFRLAVLGFTLYTSCFVCESLRSGINTVPIGQAEAARALGLTFFQVLRIVVLPQAFRSVVAPLASVLIALTKNTTVTAAIAGIEAAALMAAMIERESDKVLLVFGIFAVGFVILTLPMGMFLGWVAKKVSVKR